MLTKTEIDLKLQWMHENVDKRCASCEIDGMGCRKQARAIACVQCKEFKRDCSRMHEWRTWKEQRGTSLAGEQSAAPSQAPSSRPILVPKPRLVTGNPLVFRKTTITPSTANPSSRLLVRLRLPSPPPTSPPQSSQLGLASDPGEEQKPVINQSVQALPLPPSQDPIQRLENQVRSLKHEKDQALQENKRALQEKERKLQERERELQEKERELQNMGRTLQQSQRSLREREHGLQEKENVIDTLVSGKAKVEVELREIRRTRLDEFLHISANRIKFQGTVSSFFARQLPAPEFLREMQEHEEMLEDLGRRHLDQFPTDFSDGVDLLDDYRRDADSAGDERTAKKMRLA